MLGVGTNIVDDGPLEVRQFEVPSFTYDVVLDTAKLVEFEGTVTRLDYRRTKNVSYRFTFIKRSFGCVCFFSMCPKNLKLCVNIG